MDYEQAVQRLHHHANLTDAGGEGWASFVGALPEVGSRNAAGDLMEQTADLVACLEVVNRQVNGGVPSASVGGKDRGIDRRVAYAVSAVISSGIERLLASGPDPARESPSVRAMGAEVWRVSCAWEAVLAGDIDSLSEHVRLEEWRIGKGSADQRRDA